MIVKNGETRIPCVVFNLIGKRPDIFEKENPRLEQIGGFKSITGENQSYAYPLTEIFSSNDKPNNQLSIIKNIFSVFKDAGEIKNNLFG